MTESTVDCLACCWAMPLACLTSFTRRTRLRPSTRSTVAIALGHDTDTTAAIAGGLAGLKFGLAGIPEPWCAALRGQHWVRPLLDRLLFPIDEATP